MPITPQQLEALIREVEAEDPIDFADLPFKENELRALAANNLCEMMAKMDGFSDEDRQLALLAVAAKLVLENLALNLRLLSRDGHAIEGDVGGLLRRLRGDQ